MLGVHQPQPETPGRTGPSLFDKCTGFVHMRYTTHETNGFTSHPKDEAMISVLRKDISVTAGDSNTHSADQKHQSLNSVLLTARPQHFHLEYKARQVLNRTLSTTHGLTINQTNKEKQTYQVLLKYPKICNTHLLYCWTDALEEYTLIHISCIEIFMARQSSANSCDYV